MSAALSRQKVALVSEDYLSGGLSDSVGHISFACLSLSSCKQKW